MRKILVSVAALAALSVSAFLVDATPAKAAEASMKSPLAAFEKGDVQASYVQYRGRRGYYGRPGYAPRRGYYGRPYYGRPYYGNRYYQPNYGGAAAAGALGLATGAIIGGAIAQQQAAPVYSSPNSSVAYCQQRFKSYDVRSGTYLGYDGRRHACP